MSFKNRCTISSSYEFQAHQQRSQRRCWFSQNALLWYEVLPDAHRFVAALPGALLCNATHRLGDRQRVILRQRVRGSVRAVRAVRNTRVFQTETRVVADVQSVWRIASVIGLTEGLVTDIDNLRIRSEAYQAPLIVWDAISIEEPNQLPKSIREGLSTSIDLQEELSSSKKTENIHPDRLIRIQNPLDENIDQEDLNEESERRSQIVESTEQFIQKSCKERKAFNKQIHVDSLSRTRSGKIIAKPLTKKQRNYLQSIPKQSISTYLIDRK